MILVDNTCHNSIFKKSRLIGTFLFSLLFYSCVDNTNTNGSKSLEKDESSRKNSLESKFYTIEGFAQGTTYQIKYEASHDLKIKREIDSLLQDFDWHLSTYLDSSLISDFNNADVQFYCQIVSSIIGIGLNVNQETFNQLPQATSMYLSAHKKFDVDSVFECLLEQLEIQLNKIEALAMASLKKEYESFLFRKGMISVFEDPSGKRFNGIIQGVSDQGELIIESETHAMKTFQPKALKLLF